MQKPLSRAAEFVWRSQAIARRGRERALRSGYDNDSQLRLVLDRLDGRA